MTAVTTTQEHPILAARFTPARIRETLLPRGAWRPYPTGADREEWAALPDGTRAHAITQAEARLGMAWPELPATLFLEYKRDGDRSRFQAPHHERRAALTQLALGECVEGRGRFLDDIINGIWALCEESFWGVPAHSFSPRFTPDPEFRGRYPSAGLPDTAYPVVDLFAAETAATLAWTQYLLGERIAEELPVVGDRIEREARDRILIPYRTIDGWNWLGKRSDGRPPNNWNPWIHSNVLTVNLLLEPDPEARRATVTRIVEGLDAFLRGYGADGGCDEGASYWGHAGGSLFDCLELLASASDGALDAFDLPLVQEIGRYIYRMHIADGWYVNFADGPARPVTSGAVLYRYGQRIGDPRLMAQGAFAARYEAADRKRPPQLNRALPALLIAGELAAATTTPPLTRDAWLGDVQVLVAREREGSSEGLFLAAKGGHNNESHNHNDVGNFIVAVDGHPVLIDAGVGEYTRQTFGPDRYSIWVMQSAYHNLPLIDERQQYPGREAAAREVSAWVDERGARLTLDLAAAYPPEAGARRWTRALRLERGAGARIVLEEDYELAREPRSLALHLMASGPVDVSQPGLLQCASPTRPLLVEYDAQALSATVEPVDIDDARLGHVWGARVYRVILTAANPQARGGWTLVMRAGTA